MNRRGGTCNGWWGAGRTGGATCEENARTGGDFTRVKKSRAGRQSRARVKDKNS